MGFLGPVVRQQAIDLGVASPGAKLYTWLSGTSTPQFIYADAALVTHYSIPLVADSTGRFAPFWLADVAYRMTLLDADGATIWGPTDGISTEASGIVPGGSNTYVQYNAAGAFGGSSGLTFNSATSALALLGAMSIGGNLAVAGSATVGGASVYPTIVTDFVPILGGSGGTSGQSYTSRVARAIKTGPRVTATIAVVLSAKGTITGNVELQGLPYTVRNDAAVNWAAACVYSGFSTTWVSVMAQARPNTTTFVILGAAAAAIANNTPLTTADLSNTAAINATVTYETTD